MSLSPSQVIVLATPVFLLLIAAEIAWGWARGRNTYRLNDAVNSISLGMLSQLSAVFTRLLRVGIYTAVFSSVALWRNDAFWTAWYGWLLALVFYDFCYYWLHRAGHESAIFWAAHVVHHQSQDYNLSTALRQTSSGALLGWIFYVPMALAGVPPVVFGVVALVDLLYQFWVHTEHVPRLGWFDRWFCSPSNHRVHHAVNDGYLDRNYGGILIVWDRIFGSFQEESEPCVYGTRSPLNSWDPLWSNLEVYWSLLQDSWHARQLAGQIAGLVQAPRMASGRRGGALSEAGVRHRQSPSVTTPPSRRQRHGSAPSSSCSCSGRRAVPVARRSHGLVAIRGLGGRAGSRPVVRRRLAAGAPGLAGSAADRGRRHGHGHQCPRTGRMASRVQAAGTAAGDRLGGRTRAARRHHRPAGAPAAGAAWPVRSRATSC